LENRLTPSEFDSLSTELNDHYFHGLGFFGKKRAIQRMMHVERRAFYAVNKIVVSLKKSLKRKPEPYLRLRVKKNIQLYSDSTYDSNNKTLIIGFTGNHKRLMLPVAVFLNHISSKKFDLLLLKDTKRDGYRSGITGITNDIHGLIGELGLFCDSDKYKAVVSLGTSSGGLPAVLTALNLELDKAVFIGGAGPSNIKWKSAKGFNSVEHVTDRAVNLKKPANVLCLYSADIIADELNVEDLANYISVKKVSIRRFLPHKKLGHGFLNEFVKQYRFSSFINKVLDVSKDGLGSKQRATRPSTIWLF